MPKSMQKVFKKINQHNINTTMGFEFKINTNEDDDQQEDAK